MSRRWHCKVLIRGRPAYFVWILVPGRDNVWELVLELLLELVVVVGKSGLLHQVLLLALLLPWVEPRGALKHATNRALCHGRRCLHLHRVVGWNYWLCEKVVRRLSMHHGLLEHLLVLHLHLVLNLL